jgi:hypothetical protein
MGVDVGASLMSSAWGWHMRFTPVLSVLLPVIGLALLGARSVGRKWRTMREINLLRSLGKAPRRRVRAAKR